MNTGHGHVTPREDGMKARCGGPGLCGECAKELVQKNYYDSLAKPEKEKLERLRDEFAMHMNTNELSLEAAEIVMGCKRPKFDSFNLEVMQWWMDAEAKYRYMCADAALKAREIKS